MNENEPEVVAQSEPVANYQELRSQTSEAPLDIGQSAIDSQRSKQIKNGSLLHTSQTYRKSYDFKNNNRFNSTFTSSLQGFISSEKQSANTMRNSLVPISFPKGERFKDHKKVGDVVPYYSLKDVFQRNDNNFKRGWGFGFAKRKTFNMSKIDFPAPDRYYNKNTFSDFRDNKQESKCTFGEPWANLKKCDIDNP